MGRTGRKKTRARRARWEDLFPLSIVPRALFRLLLFYRDAQSGSLCGGERVPLLTLEAPLCLLPLYHCRIPISTIRNRGNSFVQSFPLGLRLHWRNFQPDKKQSTNIKQTFSSLFERQLGPVLSKRFLKIYTLQVSKNCLELVPGDSTFPENNFLQSVENHKLICLLSLSICLSVCLSVCLSIYLSNYLPTFYRKTQLCYGSPIHLNTTQLPVTLSVLSWNACMMNNLYIFVGKKVHHNLLENNLNGWMHVVFKWIGEP